jgi:hypothetical protein
LGTATEEIVDGWLRDIGIKSLEKTGEGNWSFLQKYGDSTVQINITYYENEPPTPPMVGVGCLFLEPPARNVCELYKRLLELQTISLETKFGLTKSGSVVLINHRSAVDLDQSEFRDMIDTILNMFNQFQDECKAIVS